MLRAIPIPALPSPFREETLRTFGVSKLDPLEERKSVLKETDCVNPPFTDNFVFIAMASFSTTALHLFREIKPGSQ